MNDIQKRASLIERLRTLGRDDSVASLSERELVCRQAADFIEHALSSPPNVGEGTIMLEIAAASDEHEMWERRWDALHNLYAIDRRFVDQDGKWGLRDVLDYVGRACGFSRAASLKDSSHAG